MNYNKIDAVFNIIRIVCGVNPFTPTRKLEYIKARAMCYKLLREEVGMTYVAIGELFNKNHATIMNGLREFPFMEQHDPILQRDWIQVSYMWENKASEYSKLEPLELKKDNDTLRKQLNEVSLELLDIKTRCKKFDPILNMLHTRLSNYKLEELEDVEGKIELLINRMELHK